MKASSNLVTSSLSWDSTVLTQLSCTAQVPMLVIQLWHLDSMVNSTSLKVKMDGTGQDTEFKETSSLNGKNGQRMLTSMYPIYPWAQRQEQISTKPQLKNSTSKLKVFHMVTITSSSVGLILLLITYHLLFHPVFSQSSSQFSRASHPQLLISSTIKLLTRDLEPPVWTLKV